MLGAVINLPYKIITAPYRMVTESWEQVKIAPKFNVFVVIWMLCHIADASLTHIILGNGGMEGNPVISNAIEYLGIWGAWAFKMCWAYFGALLLQRNMRWAVGGVIFYVALLIWNTGQLISQY